MRVGRGEELGQRPRAHLSDGGNGGEVPDEPGQGQGPRSRSARDAATAGHPAAPRQRWRERRG